MNLRQAMLAPRQPVSAAGIIRLGRPFESAQLLLLLMGQGASAAPNHRALRARSPRTGVQQSRSARREEQEQKPCGEQQMMKRAEEREGRDPRALELRIGRAPSPRLLLRSPRHPLHPPPASQQCRPESVLLTLFVPQRRTGQSWAGPPKIQQPSLLVSFGGAESMPSFARSSSTERMLVRRRRKRSRRSFQRALTRRRERP
mmetsp:Transcript_60759/g.144702  ORF Transcript_60759/g.144702 Transcript_60759/m.144702 type:complete len:202 (-) Transcript_60759:816-1421(-)